MPGATRLFIVATTLIIIQVRAWVTDITIANKQISPDGYLRSATLVNGTFPGPIINGTKGQNFQINVTNLLTDDSMSKSTSVHWHGINQKNTSYADGTAFVSQCPIAANNSFLYDFNVPDQAGTFWYHSHLSLQYCDGLRGPMIIYDPNDPHKDHYDIDDSSTVLTLSDWFHAESPKIPNPAVFNSTLINGLGRYLGGPTTPLAVVNVQQGKRYRFRMINMACDPNFIFSIDGHSLTIIEADGIETQPLLVDSIQIYPAQRYSFILNANNSIDNYWIRADPRSGSNGINSGFTGGINSAILRYAGAPNVEPNTNQTNSTMPLVETNLHPLVPTGVPGGPAPGAVDIAYNLFFNYTPAIQKFSINNVPYLVPDMPVLLSILNGARTPQELLPPGSVYTLPVNATVELSLPGGVIGGNHPMHLHGHTFHVVRSQNSTVYNYVDPVMRDTVSIGGAGDNVTIRFQTDNAGPWFLHCHIDFHLNMGFAAIFAEDVDSVASQSIPHEWDELCPIYESLESSQL